MSNTIPMYKMLSDELIEEMNLNAPVITCSYVDDDAGEKIFLADEGFIHINEAFPEWVANVDELTIEAIFELSNLNQLFGLVAITDEKNRIGVAAHIHSKTSNYQETIMVGTISSNEFNKELVLSHTFPKGMLRGKVYIDFFVFLENLRQENPFQCNIVGQRLAIDPINRFEIVVDGTGSSFPILEEEKHDEPLWRLKLDWTDIYLDSFDVNNVALILNKAHPTYKELYRSAKSSRAFLGEIMLSAMILILQKILIIDKDELNSDIVNTPDSIASAVNYWVETYDLDISSPTLDGISRNVRKQLDKSMYE